MQADNVYRFVTLRQPASVPPSEVHDPTLGAYSQKSAANPNPNPASYRAMVSAALTAGDLALAKSVSAARLAQLNVAGAWDLLAGTFYRPLFLDLPGLARLGVVKDLELRMIKAFDTNDFEAIARRADEIALEREKVADYLAACSLTGYPRADIDGAAHLICCFETIERLLAVPEAGQTASPRREAWQVPLAHGVVMLPFEIGAAVGDLSGAIGASVRLPVNPTPAKQSAAPLSFIGDLIVLKQQLRRYELGEIAHVENVLAKEKLERTHRSLARTEAKLLSVQDTEKEVSHDLQSTTRDELSQEIQKTISEQLDLSVNFDVSATYMGPAVSVTASIGGSAGYRRASEERTSTAMAHSQEVVSKASEKIRERTLTQREKVEIQETEQTAVHKFENATSEHVVGVYRWLERVFDMHLINYGRRLIYEFVVPEPASFWAALVTARGNAKSGPPPAFAQVLLAAGKPETRALALYDFSLMDRASKDLERPARWAEIVELAGQWGVALERPPAVTAQVHFALNAPGETASSTAKALNAYSLNEVSAASGPFYYQSASVSTVRSQEPLKIPAGYRATDGAAAMKGWMYSRSWGTTYYHFEPGTAHLQLNGKDYNFLASYLPSTSTGKVEISLTAEALIPKGTFIEGEVPVLLTTTLNGLTCSIRLDCLRTEAHARAWSEKTFSLFAAAHAERLARYEDERNRAEIGNSDWAGNLPSKTARDIERRELKRGILTAITAKKLALFGDIALKKSVDPLEPAPPVPDLQLGEIEGYEMALRFFEMAFDWDNLAYIFAPYFYGRRGEWSALAVADNADAQFKAFLSAGAARVQAPIRRGYEAHATYFFANLGLLPFEQRVPWLASMRPIAEDLAADAREGFDVGKGKLSVATNGSALTGINTLFRDPEDVDREIRIGGKIYRLQEIRSATEAVIFPAYRGTALSKVSYELGGIVVGPAFPLKLATTLVAIDQEGLSLPEFAPRYAQ